MKIIKALAAYYYVGIVIGYYTKNDVISWSDQIIEKYESFPAELIDVSLSKSKYLEDTASKLKKVYGEEIIREPLYQLIGELVCKLETSTIPVNEFFKYVSSLYHQGISFIDEDLFRVLDSLDDSYYLAIEGIYGDVNSIRNKAINELEKYRSYVGWFNKD